MLPVGIVGSGGDDAGGDEEWGRCRVEATWAAALRRVGRRQALRREGGCRWARRALRSVMPFDAACSRRCLETAARGLDAG